MTREELDKILESDYKNLSHADLSHTDLSRANLSHTDLSRANLSHTDLSGANLTNADLSHANLFNTDLFSADLSLANLSNANLRNANLRWADLINANLRNANLSNVNLRNTNLLHADLFSVNLSHADLSHANLSHTDLTNADLFNANLLHAILSPEDKCRLGEILEKKIIGYKKLDGDIIATLEIPKNAIVFGINKKQFRTNKAKCIALSNKKTIGYSTHDSEFSYEVGKKYTIKDFDLNYATECSTGIHFFKTLKEAEVY